MTENIAQFDPKDIDAYPAKELFVFMLVKDIGLIRAILDLVDNSFDGAWKVKENDSYDGLWTRIELDESHFEIKDNCGGISLENARKYAFRFGRPGDMPTTGRSIGQFGVGMKRALFKLGNHIHIDSKTETESFTLTINVEEWKTEREWKFKINDFESSLSEPGTKIVVTELHEPVSNKFSVTNFITNLEKEIETAHENSMSKGFRIYLNDIVVGFSEAKILKSDSIKPANKSFDIKGVNTRIIVGISDSDTAESKGWYVYCNGRSILEADQTITTGWGEGGERRIPKAHPQYNLFRGYVFFDSDDAELLPWNTTKTGIDNDSPVFQSARQQMLAMMRPVINTLNHLKKETEDYNRIKKHDLDMETPLSDAIDEANMVVLREISESDEFDAPAPGDPPEIPEEDYTEPISTEDSTSCDVDENDTFNDVGPDEIIQERRILYYKPSDKVEKVLEALRVNSLKKLGEETFDYFYRMECDD
jgi:hypothetical protein